MELILHNKWKTLADAEYSDTNPVLPPDGSTVFVHMEHIYQFFKDVEKTDNHYVVISADSDYCLVEQAKHPVWVDMQKWFNFIPLSAQQGYSPVFIPARCCSEYCRIDDSMSVKVYSYTRATFDSIPENIDQWYATNVDFDMPGLVHIPFGIPEWSAEQIASARQSGLYRAEKNQGIYVNFQSNTLDRVNLKNRFRHGNGVYRVDEEVSHEQFITDLLCMKYVLSPPGNGFDCFRTLEAIYCGCIPIVLDAPYNRPYLNMSLQFDNLLDPIIPSDVEPRYDLDGTMADFNYWRDRIFAK